MAKRLKIKKAVPKKASGKPAGVVLPKLTEEQRTARAHATCGIETHGEAAH
jgi:hypothetical protein